MVLKREVRLLLVKVSAELLETFITLTRRFPPAEPELGCRSTQKANQVLLHHVEIYTD